MIKIYKHILFICTGNTCRSPFAEGLMKKLITERYGSEVADDIRVSSAGTYAFTGVNPPADAVKASQFFGVKLSGHRSRSIHLSMMEAADIVFCMTSQHRAHLVAKFPFYEDKIFILKKYAQGNLDAEDSTNLDDYNIGDPIGQGLEQYKEVYQEMKKNIEKILEIWEKEKDFKMKMDCTYRIAIGSDHAGYILKNNILEFLKELGHEVTDFGVENNNQSVDYVDYAKPVAKAIAKGEFEYGILVCGSGVGMSISANRIKKVRAVIVSDPITAKISRAHNNTNILCLGERFTTPMVARDIVQEWLSAVYEGGRHEKRIKKIDNIDS